jgi:hypothetical protein
MDTFAKEKKALETKNKGVTERTRLPRMCEMKRIRTGWMPETRTLKD